MNQIETKFFGHLLSIGGAPLLKRVLADRLSSVGEDNEQYHIALAETCREGTTDAVEALAFAARWQPQSRRKAGNRPEHYWEAARAWAALVNAHAKGLPRRILSERLLGEAGFFNALFADQAVYADGLRVFRPAGDFFWHMEGGYPFYWGVFSSRNVKAETARFVSVDGKEVVALLLKRERKGHFPDRAAACERVNGTWSRWRVVTSGDVQEAHGLSIAALTTPEPYEARIGDELLTVQFPPPGQREGEVQTRLEFEPRPAKMVPTRGGFVAIWDGAASVVVSHPDHYAVRLEVPEGQAIGVSRIPGVTRPMPRDPRRTDID